MKSVLKTLNTIIKTNKSIIKKQNDIECHLNRSVSMAFTFIIDAGVFHPFARHCLAFALFNQLSSHFDSLIP